MEQVFVVARQDFFAGNWPQGFAAVDDGMVSLLDQFAARGRFVDRAAAEQDPTQKQLIPYCVIRRPEAVFCVQRKPAQTESRLHRLLSIGIGGHINPGPDQGPGAGAGAPPGAGAIRFRAALWQELDEEVHGLREEGAQPVFQGLLNDDSNEVGRVHVGLVYTLEVRAGGPGQPAPRIREISKMAGGFRHLAELVPLWQDPGRFESWSRILFQAGIAGKSAVTRALRTSISRPESAERNTNG